VVKNGVIIFAYHNIGVMALQTLFNEGVNIVLVITHKDNANENIWFDSVADFCEKKNLNYIFSEDYTNHEIEGLIAKFSIAVIFSFYYRKILPNSILNKAQYGAVNMHGSYLPRYRGRVPVNWQIINGENEGGVTLHYMIDRPDAGDIISQKNIPISQNDTPVTLLSKIQYEGKKILKNSIKSILDGTCKRIKQNDNNASYFGGRTPDDGKIDWHKKSQEIYNLIRGVTYPYPGSFSYLNNKKIIIWKGQIFNKLTNQEKLPGTIVTYKNKTLISTLDHYILLEEIFFEGINYKSAVLINNLGLTGQFT